MKVHANTLRPGNILDIEGKLWRVLKTEHVKPGKGGAFAQVEMKELGAGTKRNERFRSETMVEKARLEEYAVQFLYRRGDRLVFMRMDSYEQLDIGESLLDDMTLTFLSEGQEGFLSTYESRIVSVRLPEKIVIRVATADAVVKGQTAASSYKPATLVNGHVIQVPPFVEADMDIVVDTATGTYVERAKK